MKLLDWRNRQRPGDGQALVEFAMVFPLFVLALMGVITLGLWIFYQQQVTNAAREAARWAAIHSSTAQCPTVSWKDPQAPPLSYYRCDAPGGTSPWPNMTTAGRSKVWGIAPTTVQVNACWSGYIPPGSTTWTVADYPAVDTSTNPPTANQLVQCTIGGIDPITSAETLGCATGMTSASDDPASDKPDNRVTVYACTVWSPPMAGFLMIPSQVTMRAVITEVIQRQQ